FVFIKNSFFLIIINLIASFFIALSLPAINGAYADYISESPKLEKEIETLEDSFTNLGYVVGPVAAGFISQYFGYTTSFSLLGVCGLIVGFILFYFTPKKINLKIKNF
ncbi:MAG TPA: MFS transporter, partial [Candidatus Magasanikbacteria bacterium]|nr:MFS transporter [Candidatus Magasanikbacteria bacterium]